MPTKLSLPELIRLADIHTGYEFTHEIDPLMATVDPNPCWIYEPIGCEIRSTVGVSQMYQRMFPVIGAMQQPRVVNSWFADDGFIGEVEINKPLPDGSMATSSQFSWCEFNGDLICGEASYFDVDAIGFVSQMLGESFFKLPGVSMISPVDS